ncbi:MAG: IPT/TIG domain-containing protein, partial [bacterium]
MRANQLISGIGIPAHTFVVGPPALVPGIGTPTYAITISNMLTASFTNANIQIHGWPLIAPDYINGLSSLLSVSPSWNKSVSNINVVNYTTTVGTSTGNYLILDRSIDWITEGSTITIGGNQLVDSTGAAITVIGVNAEAISLSATPTILPVSYPVVATFTPVTTFSGGNVILGGGGDDIIYSQGSDNVIDGEAYLHTCISVTNADGSAFTTSADVPCGSGMGYSNLNILNHIAGQGLISSLNMNVVREIKYPTDLAGNPTSCAYTCNTLVYAGTQTQYTITPMVNPMGDVQYLVITKPDGTDIVRNVKTIQFGNPTINTLLPVTDIWANLCFGGVACINLASNYPPISTNCLSVCPAPNVNSFAPPTVASIAPAGGGAGTVVTITGTNFRTVVGGTTVTFAGIQATNVNIIDTMTLTCVVPAGVITGPVVVSTIGGNGTSPTSFTVVPAPTITKLSVVTGTSGTAVTITGTNLTYLTSVDINGAPAIIRTQTATTIGITVPNNASTGPVHVVTTSGIATSANFTVKPTISLLTPATGARGSSVTITGTNFTGTTAVTVGGIAVTPSAIRIVSPTSLMITIPATAITGRIVVTNAGGIATSATNYTVVIPPAFNLTNPFCVSSATTAPAPCVTSGPVGSVVTAYGTVLTGSSL